jgi:hypothetical protein
MRENKKRWKRKRSDEEEKEKEIKGGEHTRLDYGGAQRR